MRRQLLKWLEQVIKNLLRAKQKVISVSNALMKTRGDAVTLGRSSIVMLKKLNFTYLVVIIFHSKLIGF